MGMGVLGWSAGAGPWHASQVTPSVLYVAVAGSYPVVWQTRQAPGLPCFVHSSTKMGSVPALPWAPFSQVISNSVWQTAQSVVPVASCTAGGLPPCALAIINVTP